MVVGGGDDGDGSGGGGDYGGVELGGSRAVLKAMLSSAIPFYFYITMDGC